MAPRQQPKNDSLSPDSVPVTSGGGSSVDRLYEVAQRVSGIERSVGYLEASSQDTRKHLEALTKDVLEMKAAMSALLPVANRVANGIWTLVCGSSAFVLVLAGMWIKHHFGW